ncbi:unnamed protein product [Linum tenue]|uniref:Uncharacterized protein n=1 Tax=Linum tenue TaxID=586396 RepID=A0AAV0K0E6_9ROSI|nr:unnamed protein product [Linum tenue]
MHLAYWSIQRGTKWEMKTILICTTAVALTLVKRTMITAASSTDSASLEFVRQHHLQRLQQLSRRITSVLGMFSQLSVHLRE